MVSTIHAFEIDVNDTTNGLKRTVVPRTAGHGLVDLGGYWHPHPNVRLQAGIHNLFDKKYRNHQDILWLTKIDQLSEKAGYVQPDRSFFAALHVSF
jgi:outer membrane receptor for ferrienterochelin and colicin